MTSTLEAASSLFGDAADDNTDFFGSLDASNEPAEQHRDGSLAVLTSQEPAPAQDVTFSNEYYQHPSTESNFFNASPEQAPPEHHPISHHDPPNGSTVNSSYDPNVYNPYQPPMHNETPPQSASWYTAPNQDQSHQAPGSASYSYIPPYTTSYSSSSYDSYTPPTGGTGKSMYSSHPSQMQAQQSSYTSMSAFSAPPPPKPPIQDVSSFRTSSKSAYDPPFPTKRQNKSRVKAITATSQYTSLEQQSFNLSSPPLPVHSYNPPDGLVDTTSSTDAVGDFTYTGNTDGFPHVLGLPSDETVELPNGVENGLEGFPNWADHAGGVAPPPSFSSNRGYEQQVSGNFPSEYPASENSIDKHVVTQQDGLGNTIRPSHNDVPEQVYPSQAQETGDIFFAQNELHHTHSQGVMHLELSQDVGQQSDGQVQKTLSTVSYSQQPERGLDITPTAEDVLQTHKSTSSSVYDPYAPSKPLSYATPPAPQPYSAPYEAPVETALSQVGVQYIAAGAALQYAPSPSLLGSNDPLQRTSARAPVFSFGFGGRVVTCFHLSQTNTGGFDVAMSSQEAKNIRLRLLHDLLPGATSEMTGGSASFPGPLFADPGSLSTGIMNTGVAAAIKSKKVAVLKYLDERLEEMENGLGHQSQGSFARQRSESKIKLAQLLRALVDNDGNLAGNPKAETEVRNILCPQTAGGLTFNSIAMPSNEPPVATSTLRLSALNKLEEFLLAGERRQAYQYALDERLWGHALLISRSLDTEAWMDAVTVFIKSELDNIKLPDADVPACSFESLKLAYGLSGGLGASSLQILTKSPVSGQNNPALKMPALTPKTPNFIPPAAPSALSPNTLAQWSKMASVAFSNPIPGYSATLTSLGDHLSLNNWIEAGHCCYLLSPQTSSLGGAGHPSAKAVLLGMPDPSSYPGFDKDGDGFIFTEIAEFALSLTGQPKNQEAFSGLAHLQPYRLIRAYYLADMGHTAAAIRYCEAIGTSLRMHNKPSPYHTQCFLERLKELSDRLAGVPLQEKSKSWAIGRVAKPSLDSLGGWLEGRITKFIAGDGETPTAAEHNENSYRNAPYSGAFSGYSTISSAHTSQCPSPSPSFQHPSNSQSMAQSYPVGPPSVNHALVNLNRASSAVDSAMNKRTSSPIARVASATGVDNQRSYSMDGSVSSNAAAVRPNANWWEKDETAAQTPVAATFYQIDPMESSKEFTSLMDSSEISFTPSVRSNGTLQVVEDEEDLGFGNTKPMKGKPEPNDEPKSPQSGKEPRPNASPPSIKPATSSSWLGWLWKRGDTPSGGAIQANLGEEKSTFYYDKELKKWVNSKVPPQESTPSLPPLPPSRQATAPPDTAPPFKAEFGKINTSNTSSGPVRPASAAPPPRAKSLATPEGMPGSTPPPATKSLAGTPPGSRPSTRASNKRSIRSRYVDVFQQEGSGNAN